MSSGWMHSIGNVRKHWRCYVYLLPTFLLLVLFSYYPPISAMYHAFFSWNGANVENFNGLSNIISMFSDSVFLQSVVNMGKLLVFGLVVGTLVPLFVAELIFNLYSQRLKYWYRLLIIIPVVVPGIVILLMWEFILDGNTGLANMLLSAVGLEHLRESWLGNPDTALYALMFIGFPWIDGIKVLIFLARLQSIGTPIMESSAMDGARLFTRILKIDLPLLMGQIKLVLIMCIIGGLQGYGPQLILTKGGPGFSTMVPALYLYKVAFDYRKMGYACAIGLVMFIAILGLTLINMKFIKGGDTDE